ncbi:MAG: hypothetical protein ACJ78D_02675, partial [Gemmatimonadaceae bacterium]
MTRTKLRALLFIASATVFASVVAAQNPTPAQAQQMLQNPALLQQLRQKLETSGLTPEQVRSRLRAAGYPESLLDAYLPGGTTSEQPVGTTDDVFAAVTQLGIADTAEVDLLRCGLDSTVLIIPDTLPNGTIDTTQNARRRLEARNSVHA